MKKVLGIDPGFDRLGLSVLQQNKIGSPTLIFSECFETDKKTTHAMRLFLVGERVEKIINEYKPDAVAIETLFFSVNKKTALMVAEARGVILATCAKNKLPIFEYKPIEIKVAITGYGKSDKHQMMRMIPLLVDTGGKNPQDDEYDAIATGLTHLAISHS